MQRNIILKVMGIGGGGGRTKAKEEGKKWEQ